MPAERKGFTATPNEIMEVLSRTSIPPYPRRVLDRILRETLGYAGILAVRISMTELAERCQMVRQNAVRSLGQLVEAKIVLKVEPDQVPLHATRTCSGSTLANILMFNQNFEEWEPTRTQSGSTRTRTYSGSSKPFLPLDDNKKKNIKKKVPAKKRAPSTSPLRSYSYPDWLNRELWRDYCQMRARIKKPIATEGTITRRLNKLKSLIDAGHDQTRLFELAIDNSWRDFYPPKGPIRGSTQNPGKQYPACRQCGQQADNIIRGQECPFCGGEA